MEPAEAAMGRLGESIFSWEEHSWADCSAMLLIALDKQHFLSREQRSTILGHSPPFPWGIGEERLHSPRGTSTAGRCSICKSQTNALSFSAGGGWAGPM